MGRIKQSQTQISTGDLDPRPHYSKIALKHCREEAVPLHYNQGEERGHGCCSTHTHGVFFYLDACLSKDLKFFSLFSTTIRAARSEFVSH